jgi:hypothetical protein
MRVLTLRSFFLGANFEKLRMKYELFSMRMDKTLKKSIYSAK